MGEKIPFYAPAEMWVLVYGLESKRERRGLPVTHKMKALSTSLYAGSLEEGENGTLGREVN